jgi:hypothetical protein
MKPKNGTAVGNLVSDSLESTGIFRKGKNPRKKHYILLNDQLDALFLNEFISCLYMFRAQVLIIRRAS